MDVGVGGKSKVCHTASCVNHDESTVQAARFERCVWCLFVRGDERERERVDYCGVSILCRVERALV